MNAARSRIIRVMFGAWLIALGVPGFAFAQAEEDQARRQLESGRSFARQGNYAEAVRDFRVVADTYAATTVADDALLELARYYFNIANDTKEATTAVETLLKRYPTSDSAAEAYLITGRLAMTRSHSQGDLDTALANFDRVSRLFPNSSVVPHSLVAAGEAYWLLGRHDDALASLVRAEVEYPNNPATAQAHLFVAQVLVTRGDAVGAMEELQQIRNRWPQSEDAEIALGRLTILHRLYVRAKGGAPFAVTPETPGPPRIQNMAGMITTSRGVIYWAAENGAGQLTTQKPPAAPGVKEPRGLTRDRLGNPVVIEVGGLKPFAGEKMSTQVMRPNGQPQVLEKIDGAVQLYSGDWLVMDDDFRAIQRFNRVGEHQGQFGTTRVSRMIINDFDEIAAIDRDQRGVVILDGTGAVIARIPAKGTGYELPNIEALAFDAFGHLYVLDRGTIAVFRILRSSPRQVMLLATFSEPTTVPTAFRRATAFALDASGGVYLYDDRAERVRVYR